MSEIVRAEVRKGAYFDSVTLLQVTSSVAALPGVLDAAIVMATELNREVLRESGFPDDAIASSGPNDLVIAVRAADADAADTAMRAVEAQLAQRRAPSAGDGTGQRQSPRSFASALRAQPSTNLAVISVPGQYATAEARQAIARGVHVFLFSDNVSLEDEIDLKRHARDQGVLLMGPDCGTSILNGVALGFANVVRQGRIGLVGASGTGLQEVTCLLHRAGEGISQAIGTGGRDLHERVGAITTLQALDWLRDDPRTETIVLISKPPSPRIAAAVLQAAARTGKPVVACLLGAQLEAPAGVRVASNLDEAARFAAASTATWPELSSPDMPQVQLKQGQNHVRGLFCGGTLCEEAALTLGHAGPHQFIDFGDDQYTRGRAHPMIDPSLRNQAIVAAGEDPTVAVLLLDVILGFGAHLDPAGATLSAIREARVRASAAGRQLAVLAHVVGTEADPQDLVAQERALTSAGVQVFGSNYAAAVAASVLVGATST